MSKIFVIIMCIREFVITNLSKNVILIDRAPIEKSEERVLNHKSLIMIGDDCLMFFLLP